ncbi:phosphatase PAP2 family protein [Arthrobacter sp. USHLN218]|uniref:phosphatase PAP2 family protein n=1 Tax=Arthrobacter sp. USHLN218 TaxID=3081232 RepID=UPI00301A4D8D
MSDQPTRRHRTARFITEAFAPTVLVTFVLATSPLILPEVTYAEVAVAILFVTALPFATVYLLARHGTLSDHHVGNRSQRGPVMAFTGVSIIVGLWVLSLMDAALAFHRLIFTLLLGLALSMAVNLVWKLSVHAAVAAFFAAMLASASMPLGLLWGVLPLAVGWSRVRLGDHSWAQVLAGWASGLAIFAVYMLFLR